ncbi:MULTISPECIES: two-component system sensor histidine kinase NtrB [Legionella]|uniref:histidine kinase n=1 Tax=Legionella maceachernii TaxID=466 RepID=A0A0W0VWV1_9GAMM|nr:PAS domain-containing sensor histidine kinase [Legionella maceachernii]KTD24620.1 Two-component sensor histidine kinase [Legionella maceachernii]SKA25163.1 PAS domain S-box-containing protein [Legionella maceachernii]SUO99371.1 Sensor protein fixL [Legionella maceachernii]
MEKNDELEELNKKWHQILEVAPDAMLIVNEKGEIIFANLQCENIFKYSKEELLGQLIEVLIPEPYKSRHPEYRTHYFKKPRTRPMGSGMELYGQRKNQEIFPVEISLSPLKIKNGLIALAAIRDITERKKIEKTLAELNQKLLLSARQAGMAEVANAVLHNLGNVLTSISVSMECLRDKSRHFQFIKNILRINQLIRDHALDLSEFLSTDKMGKKIPEYLAQFSQLLEDEYNEITREIQNIHSLLKLAIEIISKQEAISGSAMLVENVSVEAILESAIKIADLGKIEKLIITKKIDQIPLVATDQNKLLQILINLIMNGKEALLEVDTPHKKIIISAKKHRNQHIQISVRDNGSGILPENLRHIFSFGFSTKEKGHGYGLHNSALLAKELGGSLKVTSAGVGMGATFTLTLPIKQM